MSMQRFQAHAIDPCAPMFFAIRSTTVTLAAAACVLSIGYVRAEKVPLETALRPPAEDQSGLRLKTYCPESLVEQVSSIPYEALGIYGGTLALGFADWNWGSASFSVHSEGFFGKDTYNGGMDKLGHAWGAAVLSQVFTDAIRRNSNNPEGAPLTGFLLSMGVMGAIEVFDGFSADYGFSPEDIVADTVGAAFGMLRSSFPQLQSKLDYRMEFIPSGNVAGFRPHSDYSGQKYLLALKLSGFEQFEDTPLRFVELQAGYYARGFTAKEMRDGESRRREPYVAIGINLSELLLSRQDVRNSKAGSIARKALEYLQVPYTYIPTKRN